MSTPVYMTLHDGQIFQLPEYLPGLPEFVYDSWQQFKVEGCTCSLQRITVHHPVNPSEDIVVVTYPLVDPPCPEHGDDGRVFKEGQNGP